MRIFLDLQAAQNVDHPERGIARYAVEHADALLGVGAPVAGIGLNPHLPRPRRLPERLRSSPAFVWTTAREIVGAAAAGPVGYHVMSPFEVTGPADSVAPPAAFEVGPLIVTVYDLIPHLFPERYLRSEQQRAEFRTRLELVRRADLICAISEHTRQDVIRELGVDPDRCVNIGGGASPHFSPPGPGDDSVEVVRRHVPGIERPFVLCVTGWDWRKNTEGLIRAFARLPRPLRRAHQLVLTCSIGQAGIDEWRATAANAGLEPDELVVTGMVPEVALRALYRTCTLLAFASFYEGFGLPVLEAARSGAPAITSGTSSLPEILDLPESTFDPADDEDMARLLEQGMQDPALRSRLRAAGARAAERHTWRHVAERTVEGYERLRPSLRPPRRRFRLALVSPLPPSRSGVADYTARILRYLPPSWEVTHFYEGERPVPVPGPRTFPARQLGRVFGVREFDAVVYVIGNSTFHTQAIELAAHHGGIVWFHDVFLAGIELYEAGRAGDRLVAQHRMGARLAASYEERVPVGITPEELLDIDTYRTGALRLTGRVAARAEHIIVNSEQAAALVRLELGPDRHPPVTAVPFMIPEGADLIDEAVERSPTPLVVSLGIVDEVKRPLELLQAVASLPVSAGLRFVGECRPDLRARLEAEAAGLGYEGLEVTGALDARSYARAAAEGWVAAQLRAHWNGESSAAVADAIALGLPVLTSVTSSVELGPEVHLVAADTAVPELSSQLRALFARGAPERFDPLCPTDGHSAADVAAALVQIVDSVVNRPLFGHASPGATSGLAPVAGAPRLADAGSTSPPARR